MFDFLKTVRSPEHRLAWLVAMAADAIQIGALPLFAAGGLSPADALLDLGVAAILIRLLGWHWAFLPTMLAELIPGFDLFPTWTAAVFYVSRQRVRSEEPEILPPGRPRASKLDAIAISRMGSVQPVERDSRVFFPNPYHFPSPFNFDIERIFEGVCRHVGWCRHFQKIPMEISS